MKHTKRIRISRLAAVCAAIIMVMGLATAAYAADVGGIQRNIQLWINGDQTDAVLDIQGVEYTVTYRDQYGNSHEIGGGGIALEADGTERPLTEAEILESLDSPDVQYRDDNTVWVCYHDKEIEITDKFDENGVCYVQLNTDSGVIYLTVKYNDGYAASPHHYVSPKTFNTTPDPGQD